MFLAIHQHSWIGIESSITGGAFDRFPGGSSDNTSN